MQRIIQPPFGCRLPQSMAEALKMYGSSYDIPSNIKNCIRHGLKTWTDWAAWQAKRNVQQHYGRMRNAYWARRVQKGRGRSAAAAEQDLRRMLPEFTRSRQERAFWVRLAAEAKAEAENIKAFGVAARKVLPTEPTPLPSTQEAA